MMTILDYIKMKGLSRYSLSKLSGIPWATLSDICSGKTSLSRCNAQTLYKLSKALDLSVEEILSFQEASYEIQKSGKPKDMSYLELNLSPHLTKARNDYIQGEKENVSYLDCLWGELYGSINADFWTGCITEEQACYLRNKYLFGEEEKDD